MRKRSGGEGRIGGEKGTEKSEDKIKTGEEDQYEEAVRAREKERESAIDREVVEGREESRLE